jgi:DnaJ family protein C protein 27
VFFLWYILAQVDKRRDVSEEEGREFASSRGFIYFETSACTGANVTEVFEHLFQKIVANT